MKYENPLHEFVELILNEYRQIKEDANSPCMRLKYIITTPKSQNYLILFRTESEEQPTLCGEIEIVNEFKEVLMKIKHQYMSNCQLYGKHNSLIKLENSLRYEQEFWLNYIQDHKYWRNDLPLSCHTETNLPEYLRHLENEIADLLYCKEDSEISYLEQSYEINLPEYLQSLEAEKEDLIHCKKNSKLNYSEQSHLTALLGEVAVITVVKDNGITPCMRLAALIKDVEDLWREFKGMFSRGGELLH